MPSPSQATGADGVGSEVDDQSDSLDGDVALPALLNVLEAKEDGKGERDEKDEEEEEEKEEGEQLAGSFAASAFEASDAEQPKAEPADGSGSDGEDALETLGRAPPESESDVGISGQRSDSGDSGVQIDDSPTVQHPTLLDVVNASSKEKMAAKLQEKREKQEKREPESLLAQGLLQATWHMNAFVYLSTYPSIYLSYLILSDLI